MLRKHPVLLLFAIVGLLVFGWMTGREAQQSGQTGFVSRAAAGQLAADFLHGKGISLADFDLTVLYQGESKMEAYLKRHKLLGQFEEQTQQSGASQLPLTRWQVTYFQPGKNAYQVWIDETNGRVLGYTLLAAPATGQPGGGSPAKPTVQLAANDAVRLTREELTRQGVNFANLQLVKAHTPQTPTEQTTEQYVFHFRDEQWKVGQSAYFYKVGITGKQVTTYQAYYESPAADQQWFQQQEKWGFVLTGVSLLGILLLVILSLVVAFVYPKPRVDWQRGLMLGLLLLLISLIKQLNEWPVLLANMSLRPEIPVEWVLWGTALLVTLLAVLSSSATYLTGVAGAVLHNDLWRGKWLQWGDGHWPERIRGAVWRGYLLAFIWLGLQGVFYWISENWFGVWSEESDYSTTPWNNLIPGLFPIMAWTAGIGEELTFRLLGMGLVKKYLRSTFLALFLPSMIWALAHSLYPVHPYYTRFIELTLFGMMIGWFFLKYDLETVIFAHIMFNTILMSLPLFAGSWAEVAMGVFWLALPALVGKYAHLLQPRWVRQRECGG